MRALIVYTGLDNDGSLTWGNIDGTVPEKPTISEIRYIEKEISKKEGCKKVIIVNLIPIAEEVV